jgi:hypothetical protein
MHVQAEPLEAARPNMGRFLRYGPRVTIAVAMATLLYGVLAIWMPYHRELNIARKIVSLGGSVQSDGGLQWAPLLFREKVILFDRIQTVILAGTTLPAELLSEIGQLANLQNLELQIEDLSDDGLEPLTRLRNLRHLNLDRTQTTPAGRAKLQMALPNCIITPAP